MGATMTRLPITDLDRFWAESLGCEPTDFRSGGVRLVAVGQRQVQVIATPDGAVVIGHPGLIRFAQNIATEQLLDPIFWATQFDLPLSKMAHFGPGSLSYVTRATFHHPRHAAVQPLRRDDAGELARFARILKAREPHIFHSWAIGGRVTANEKLWGAMVAERIVAVAGLRQVHKQFYEVGINTLPAHRRQGWGTAVAAAATDAGLHLAPLVQWSAPLNNEPSMRIARRLGFLPYAHQLWLAVPSDYRL
jgi:RimJ/RimL family protein N-acetyltransferase